MTAPVSVWMRGTLVGVTALVLALAFPYPTRAATCLESKHTVAGRKVFGTLACHATAVKRGRPVATRCLERVERRFVEQFGKADAKGGCPTTGNAPNVGDAVDACVSTTLSALGGASPPPPPCVHAKVRAAGAGTADQLGCWAVANPADPLCLVEAEAKLANAFAKAELRAGCTAGGDAAGAGALVDACVDDVREALLTGTPPPPPPPPPSGCAGEESSSVAGIVGAHNAARAAAHPLPVPALEPLCWSAAAADVAQAWARTCTWAHNPNRGALGENLYAVGYPGSVPSSDLAAAAVGAWVEEVADYDYDTNRCSGVCGHYTQVVWRSTRAVGCAIQHCTTGSPFGSRLPNWTIVVCDYDPPGNYSGQRPY